MSSNRTGLLAPVRNRLSAPDGNEVERLTGVPPMAELQRLINRGANTANAPT